MVGASGKITYAELEPMLERAELCEESRNTFFDALHNVPVSLAAVVKAYWDGGDIDELAEGYLDGCGASNPLMDLLFRCPNLPSVCPTFLARYVDDSTHRHKDEIKENLDLISRLVEEGGFKITKAIIAKAFIGRRKEGVVLTLDRLVQLGAVLTKKQKADLEELRKCVNEDSE